MLYRHEEAAQRLKFIKAETRLLVVAEGLPLAGSDDVIWLAEGDYPKVAYFPRKDVDFSRLKPTETVTTCPFKGQARYYALCDENGHVLVKDVAWSYETPIAESADIAEYLAFYPNKVSLVEG